MRQIISQTLYKSYIEKVSLFKGCSLEFINQVVTKVHEEFFLPGEVIMEQSNAVEQLYFICHGELEEIGICEDGSEETVSNLKLHSSFGEFNSSDAHMKQLETDIILHIGKHEAELALRVNSSAFYGDLYQLKSLIRAGADLNKKDYDGRTSLHLAASKGYEDITLFLIQDKVEVKCFSFTRVNDNFGNTPLLEATKNGHDKVASILVKEGGSLKIDDAGWFLCTSVARGDIDYIRRILSNGVDPNSKDYDFRTPLHVAASQGSYIIVKLLVEAGASVLSKDRWGNTPLDEGRMSGNEMLIKLLEEAKDAQLSELPEGSQEIRDKMHPRKCTVYAFHPWEEKDKSTCGVVLWIPRTTEQLIRTAAEQLKLESYDTCCIVTEDAEKILDNIKKTPSNFKSAMDIFHLFILLSSNLLTLFIFPTFYSPNCSLIPPPVINPSTIQPPSDHHLPPEFLAFTSPKHLPFGMNSNFDSDKLYPPVGSPCTLFQELKNYMSYPVNGSCPDDELLAQKLLLKGCEPLPRRRCRPPSLPDYTEPYPLPKSFWSTPPDSSVIWTAYTCKNYSCLINRSHNQKHFDDCKDCFDLEGREKTRWVIKGKTGTDFSIDEALAMKKHGTIRIGLDIGGGVGTFAVRMMERNITIVTTSMNLNGPFNSFIASRGVVPMVLRPGGLFWLDHFFCVGEELEGM
uniref:Cyclic nucleotide-binding domain-containing protein n=1 Tax=Lactuca sativa TaxID=4236 RepID=A0A9R1W409_LACSA|nr:hypothetical protein LSAT_V11C300126990 [Lactuca sativa]